MWRTCAVASWHPVTRGESGAEVFRSADGLRYAKVVGPDQVDVLAAERDRIAWAHGRGLPTPAVLDWRATEHGARLVMTAVAGVPADQLSPDDFSRAWPSIADSVRALHDITGEECPFRRDLDTMLELARDVVSRDAVNPDFLPDDDKAVAAAALLERVEAEAEARRQQEQHDRVVCHGDLCLPNLLVDGGRFSGFIDLGRLGVADPHADLALLLANVGDTYGDLARVARDVLDAGYPPSIDDDRLTFYLRLDPLTWG
ncbi:APH(3'') family aminoglycoside O-phosphotransferase [Mycobacterium sp. URHB0044]|uniref:APH(3'') family aminoglycoside O-phosphotransferase n=1 Tax=Mycobacterium sp. URHB0044 TaxID=1380386 RepID=UPI000490365C|nr:APH(3'') family aminoglycoside O-phosphotransferase [Mycobacterium sp. URHB0044]